MGNPKNDKIVFFTLVYSAQQMRRAGLLIDGIRSFGGALKDCPIWLFQANPEVKLYASLESKDVKIIPLNTPATTKSYLFARKVYAFAKAEELAAPETQSLIWLIPECLIVKPPMLFELGQSFDAAVRPVHIKNVGLLATEPLDDFWKKIYDVAGVSDIKSTVESFVDIKRIRAYFNSAALSVNPSKGLFRRWFECFVALVCDQEFQLSSCQDKLHQIFLHQAILSTLLVTMLEPERTRILPPDYGYPYNLHQSVPPERRARVLNDLVCVIYEERPMDPNRIDDIEIHEPLRTFLAKYADIYKS